MKTLYLDIFSGMSGDMFVAALIDVGAHPHRLEHELAKLQVDGYHLHVGRATKASIAGVRFEVHLEADHGHGQGHHHEHEHEHEHESHQESDPSLTSATSPAAGHHHDHDHARTFSEITRLITASPLSEWVRERAISTFRRIAVAEGAIHGLPPEQVHFHEVGAVDSIVDIVGACIALELLGKPRVLAGPVVEGTGWIHCAHGRFPIPAPATLAILGARGIPLTQCEEPHELVTPTGAALLAEFVESFGPMRGLVAQKIGFGLGTRDNHTRPNVLRAILGETESGTAGHDWETDTIVVLEANVDDISSELLGHFLERALAQGALDVFYTPVQMKKNRPAVLVTVLCTEADADKFTELLLRETTTFGVRRATQERRKLHREFVAVATPYGPVTLKLGKLDGQTLHATPEYEACKSLAEKAGVPLKVVFEAAVAAFAGAETDAPPAQAIRPATPRT
jgi:uncharacterized protein (TIGR00299 family) protein